MAEWPLAIGGVISSRLTPGLPRPRPGSLSAALTSNSSDPRRDPKRGDEVISRTDVCWRGGRRAGERAYPATARGGFLPLGSPGALRAIAVNSRLELQRGDCDDNAANAHRQKRVLSLRIYGAGEHVRFDCECQKLRSRRTARAPQAGRLKATTAWPLRPTPRMLSRRMALARRVTLLKEITASRLNAIRCGVNGG